VAHARPWLQGEQLVEPVPLLGCKIARQLPLNGHRRHPAAVQVGLKEVPSIVLPEGTTEAQIREIQLVTQLQSESLTPFETYVGAKNWLQTGGTAKELAAAISKSEGYVSMLLSLDRCCQAVKDAAAAGKIGLKDWYEMAKVCEEQQLQMLQARLGGATAEQVKRIVRKAVSGVRTAKVKCQMPSGVTVTLAGQGEGMTLNDVIEELTSLLKAAKTAANDGLDASTFSAVMRDRAKTR
jgi:hypothetical protein